MVGWLPFAELSVGLEVAAASDIHLPFFAVVVVDAVFVFVVVVVVIVAAVVVVVVDVRWI